jgi:hypothetical protein
MAPEVPIASRITLQGMMFGCNAVNYIKGTPAIQPVTYSQDRLSGLRHSNYKYHGTLQEGNVQAH